MFKKKKKKLDKKTYVDGQQVEDEGEASEQPQEELSEEVYPVNEFYIHFKGVIFSDGTIKVRQV